jgi:hypothetical protein
VSRKGVIVEKRYEGNVDGFLLKAANEGFSSVSKWRLLTWYGQSRFSVGILRDLKERWLYILDEWEVIPEIQFIETNYEKILIVRKDFFIKN